MTGPEARDVPVDDGNLVLRAARLLAEAGGRRAAARLHLDKHLPVAAGIGGGSSDAAATLRALNRLWGLEWPLERLEALGGALGADVPVCVRARTVRMRGIGERLDPVELPGRLHLLLVNPKVQVPTGPVFRELGAPPAAPDRPPVLPPVDQRLGSGRNDLELPASRLEPRIADVLDAIRSVGGARVVRMSGSGATCFGWFERQEAAAVAAADLARRQPGWWIRPVTAGDRP